MAPLVFHQSEHAEHAARRLSTFCLANPGVTWRPPPPPLADTSPMTRAIFTKKPNRIPRSPAARAACYQARGEKNRNQGVVMPSSRNSPTVCNWQLVLLDASTYLFFFFFGSPRVSYLVRTSFEPHCLINDDCKSVCSSSSARSYLLTPEFFCRVLY